MYTYIGPNTLKPLTPLLPPSRKLTSISLGSVHSTSFSGCPPEFPNDYFLTIISALKGKDHSYLSRSDVAEYILGITDSDLREQLVDFLGEKQGAIASTLENNACKHFNCSLDQLSFIGLNDPSECALQLIEVFQQITQKIIPNAIGMLYPLQHFDPDFNIRRTILTHFRDRVLVNILGEIDVEKAPPESIALIQPMLSLVNQETQESTIEFRQFKRVSKRFFAKFLSDLKNPRKAWPSAAGGNYANEQAGNEIHSAPVGDHSYNYLATKRRKAFQNASPSFFNSVEKSEESLDIESEEMSPNLLKSSQRKFSDNLQRFRIESFEDERKARSTTMPSSKSVTWDDQTTVHV